MNGAARERRNTAKEAVMICNPIDYERLGVEACEAFAEGPATFVDFVRTILSIAAPLHVLQSAMTGALPEPRSSLTALSETKH